MIRIYFNQGKEAPHVWSFDEGDVSTEVCVQGIVIGDAPGHAVYMPERVQPEPKAWIQFDNATFEVRNGKVLIYESD